MTDEPDDDAPDTAEDAARGERIAKYLARAGIASRRDAEKLIADGKVKLNGKVVEAPATFVAPGDRISVDGKPVAAPERTRLFRYHKPDGLVTTHRDPQGRPTVFEKLPTGLPRVVSIGRLDLTSEGLLLLTNDGALARRLELPTNGWLRRYRVRVHGAVDERQLAYLSRGITIEGVAYGPIEAGLDSRQGANAWLTVSLKEGKNREIRRVMAHLGLQVTRLIRMAYGPFQLGALPRGGVEEVHPRILRDQLGIGEKPQRRRAAAEPAPESPPPTPKPSGPSRGHTIPRARNAAPRRPARAQTRRRPPSRP
jgi:23S rRNA pseudouridine2605 synthase